MFYDFSTWNMHLQQKHQKLEKIPEVDEEGKENESFHNMTTPEDLKKYDYRFEHRPYVITEIGEMKLANGECVGNRKYQNIYDQNMSKEKAKEHLGLSHSESLNSSTFHMIGEQSSSFSLMNSHVHETSLQVQKMKKKEKQMKNKILQQNRNPAYTNMPTPYAYKPKS